MELKKIAAFDYPENPEWKVISPIFSIDLYPFITKKMKIWFEADPNPVKYVYIGESANLFLVFVRKNLYHPKRMADYYRSEEFKTLLYGKGEKLRPGPRCAIRSEALQEIFNPYVNSSAANLTNDQKVYLAFHSSYLKSFFTYENIDSDALSLCDAKVLSLLGESRDPAQDPLIYSFNDGIILDKRLKEVATFTDILSMVQRITALGFRTSHRTPEGAFLQR